MFKFLMVSIFPWLFLFSFLEDMPKTKPTGSVELNIRAVFGEKLLVMFRPYDYASDQSVFFEVFDFYLSSVALGQEDSRAETTIMKLGLVDFSDITDFAAAEEGIHFRFDDIPVANYTELRFGIGVPLDLNRPGDYASAHPLGGSSGEIHFWAAWKNYIFARIQGKADIDGNGTFSDLPDKSLAYHIGHDRLYRTISIPVQLSVKKNSLEKIKFILDLRELFVMGDGMLNLAEFPFSHSQPNQVPPVAEDMVNRWENAFKNR